MIKLGIIGLGNVAQSVHLPVLKSRNDVQLVWICDKQKLVKDISNKISIPYYFDLNEKQIKTIYIISTFCMGLLILGSVIWWSYF